MISRKIVFVLIAVVVALSVGIVVYRLQPQALYSKETFQFGGIGRTYYLHIPPSYNGRTSVPLVIVIHGFTETIEDIETRTGFTPKSDKEGFIVVYPEGVVESWNAHYGMGKAHEQNIDDVGFINEIINRLEQKYVIDPKRIYVTGLSNGAMMAYRLGAELSDRIAAIAPVAGSIGGQANESAILERIPEPSQPVSVIIFHGTNDALVNYYGGLPSDTTVGKRVDLSVAEAVAFWVRCDGCSINPLNETSSDGKVIKSVYSGGNNGTEVVLYTLVGWVHDWPRQSLGVIEATDIMWDFFESHPKQ